MRQPQPHTRLLSLFYWLPLPVWMTAIFLASTSVGASEVSLALVTRVAHFLIPDQFDLLDSSGLGKLNFIVRKCAHITEYAILTLILIRALQFGAKQLRLRSVGVAIAVSFLFACTDEWHQSFVPGRTPAIRDVFIDTVGATVIAAGVVIWYALKRLELRLWSHGDH